MFFTFRVLGRRASGSSSAMSEKQCCVDFLSCCGFQLIFQGNLRKHLPKPLSPRNMGLLNRVIKPRRLYSPFIPGEGGSFGGQ